MEFVTATTGSVRIVGTGLLGTSIALALRAQDIDVYLADASPSTLRLAVDMGAGVINDAASVDLVVVAVPPDVTAEVILRELERYPNAVVTDVASVKAEILDAVAAGGGDLSRYVPGHPMAGRENSGPLAARGDLFLGRPWVVSSSGQSTKTAQLKVRALVADMDAVLVQLPVSEHDAAVGLVSHLPQLAASLVAARLEQGSPQALELAGQGLRDVTRIAASDSRLWASIIAANSAPIRQMLIDLQTDLQRLVAALEQPEAPGALGVIAEVIEKGNAGVKRIPGKHGGSAKYYDEVIAMIPDKAGQLGRLFQDLAEGGINVEDFRLEHSISQPVGLGFISVRSGNGPALRDLLLSKDWQVQEA